VDRQAAVGVAAVAEASKSPGESNQAATARPKGRVVKAIDSVPLKWWFTGVGVVILAVSAAFGGLADAQEVRALIPQLQPGDQFVGPELSATLHSAELTDVAPDYTIEPEAGNTYLVVTATVTNNWKESTILISDLLRLEWLKDEAEGVPSRVALLSDGTSLPQANPGVPIEVAYIWEVPLDALTPGDDVEVAIRTKTFVLDGDVTYGSYWADPVTAATVTLEVEG